MLFAYPDLINCLTISIIIYIMLNCMLLKKPSEEGKNIMKNYFIFNLWADRCRLARDYHPYMNV